jgi:hypothetical protein
MAFDTDLFTHDIGSGAELALPKLIANDSDLGICAGTEIRIVRRKQTAKKRSCAKYGVGVTGNGQDAIPGKYAVDFNVGESVRAPGHKRGEDPLAAFDFAEHRIGKGDFVSLTDGRKSNEALWLADREVTEEQGVDQSEDGGVCADAEG